MHPETAIPAARSRRAARVLVAGAALVGFASLAPALAAAAPTRAQLALMMLPRTAFGPGLPPLSVQPDSGVTTNAEVALNSVDPTSTPAKVTAAGRRTGYLVTHASGDQITSVATAVDVFRDAKAVARYIPADIASTRRAPLVKGEREFTVRGLLDGRGVTAFVTLDGGRMFATAIEFRRGALMGSVVITGRRPDVARATRVARALDRRMAGVLAGQITGQPVPIPAPPKPGPAGGPNLGLVALRLEDLPRGAKRTSQGYVRPEGAAADYVREFDLDGVREPVGTSRFLFILSRVERYATAAQATAYFAGSDELTADEMRRLFASFIEKDGGAPFTTARAVRIPAAGVGDEAVAFRVHLGTGGPVSVDAVMVATRVGPFVQWLTVAALGNQASPGRDAVALARTLAERARAVAGAS